jgi:hypothetical protein
MKTTYLLLPYTYEVVMDVLEYVDLLTMSDSVTLVPLSLWLKRDDLRGHTWNMHNGQRIFWRQCAIKLLNSMSQLNSSRWVQVMLCRASMFSRTIWQVTMSYSLSVGEAEFL